MGRGLLAWGDDQVADVFKSVFIVDLLTPLFEWPPVDDGEGRGVIWIDGGTHGVRAIRLSEGDQGLQCRARVTLSPRLRNDRVGNGNDPIFGSTMEASVAHHLLGRPVDHSPDQPGCVLRRGAQVLEANLPARSSGSGTWPATLLAFQACPKDCCRGAWFDQTPTPAAPASS